MPELPFSDNQFDIVLSGHFLFLYADRLDSSFHLKSLLELARISKKEVRIYPLIGLDGTPYAEMDRLLDSLREKGLRPQLKPTPFHFLKGSHQLLSILKPTSSESD